MMAGERRKLMGVLAIRIDSTRVEWYYKGKDREIPFHCRNLTKGCRKLYFKTGKAEMTVKKEGI